MFVFPGTCLVLILLLLATLRFSRPRLSLIVTVLWNQVVALIGRRVAATSCLSRSVRRFGCWDDKVHLKFRHTQVDNVVVLLRETLGVDSRRQRSTLHLLQSVLQEGSENQIVHSGVAVGGSVFLNGVIRRACFPRKNLGVKVEANLGETAVGVPPVDPSSTATVEL